LIDRLYKVFCFWRNHGSRALIRLVLIKLRLAGSASPSIPHVASVRDLAIDRGTARNLVTTRFEACSPLLVFSIPNAVGNKRITIVTDSINSGSLYGGVGTAIIIAALLAEATKAHLRVVTRTERAHTENLWHVLETYGIQLGKEVEFVFAPFYDKRAEIDLLEGERFITTSWWTTAATMASVPHESIIYLLQEDERMFYPHGDDHLRCSTIMQSKDIRYLINTQLLFDHLVGEGFSNVADSGKWFEPAFPAEVFYPRPAMHGRKLKLFFYARPNNLRNLFFFGIDLLEEAVTRGLLDLEHWDIVLVGKDIPKIVLGETYVPEIRENLTWSEYAELIGNIDLGLSLMYTPHPSYPPLDLAASGAVVVTNRFANKRDLSAYSKNIICGDLDRVSMLDALVEGIRLASDKTTRASNYRASALLRDWKASTADIIRSLANPD
jgi:O-antigen biosynthesis protein